MPHNRLILIILVLSPPVASYELSPEDLSSSDEFSSSDEDDDFATSENNEVVSDNTSGDADSVTPESTDDEDSA